MLLYIFRPSLPLWLRSSAALWTVLISGGQHKLMRSALFCQMSTGLSPAHRSFHFPVPSNIRFDPSPHMFDVVLIDYEMTAWQQDSGWQQQQQQQDGRLGGGQLGLQAPRPITAQACASRAVQCVGEIYPAGGARGMMISQAGGRSVDMWCCVCPGSSS